MCGISGLINGGDPQTLARMADVQHHRGPDDRGLEWFPGRGSGLAHNRLAILDISPAGHQPMCDVRGNRWITYNGEIYNYRELRGELQSLGHRFTSATDTEVILAAYNQWGEACLDRLDGMFAFGIYDVERDEVFLARDHLGIKPLYYYHNGAFLAFASEAKALREICSVGNAIDPDAVVSALMFLWVPEPSTGFTDIKKLEAGHYARFSGGRMQIRQYWDIPIGVSDRPGARSEQEYVEELRELLERTVRRQMVSDVPVGAFLSGGLDSSVVAALMRRVSNGKIGTYTIAFRDEDLKMEAMPDDAGYASRLARTLGTEHVEIEVTPEAASLLGQTLWHLDDPVCDGAAINTWLIARGARESGSTVLLNGMGGDEVFGGYRKQLATLMIERYRRSAPLLRRGLIEPVVRALPVAIGGRGIRTFRWAKRFVQGAAHPPLDAFMFGFSYFDHDGLRQILRDNIGVGEFEDLYPVRRYREMATRVQGLPLVEQMCYLDTKVFMPGINLLYSDKAAMAASVETRPPLIDRQIVEFMARVPHNLKIHGRQQKYLLKRAAEAWLPHDIIYRPKAAFGSPIRAWMKQGLADQARSTFEQMQPGSAAGHFLSPKLPMRLLDEHRRGSHDNAHRLWGLYALATWIEGVGDKSVIATPNQSSVIG